MAIRIRAAQAADCATLYAIDQSCFAPGIAWSKAELIYFLRHPRNFGLVAEGEESTQVKPAIVGFAIAGTRRRQGQLSGHLITIDVREAHRRRGVGDALLAAIEERLRAENIATVGLEVAVDNAGAQGFYARHGFVRTGRIPGYYLGRIDALAMEKTL
ncbi:MAG: N-acetyltransferase [Acidobacteriaceae bacterium]